MSLSVLLAVDQRLGREALRALLEPQGFRVVRETWEPAEAAKLARELEPDAALLDFVLPALQGLEAARLVRQASPGTKPVLLTTHTEDRYVLDALRAGARGYVLKSQAAVDLFQAIREVARGAVYLSPGISEVVVRAWQHRADPERDPLTPRAAQVLGLVAQGRTTKEIAGALGMSVKTAESHRSRIMKRLEIHDTAGLVRYAIRRGLITP
jgi:DNA-binding NarL/FixJ family response regulator